MNRDRGRSEETSASFLADYAAVLGLKITSTKIGTRLPEETEASI